MATRDSDRIRDRLEALASNLWWTYDWQAQRLFAGLDPEQWEASHHNPRAVLGRLDPGELELLARDRALLEQLGRCEHDLCRYLDHETWFARTWASRARRLKVAYFSAEFALHESLPIYCGGLGVLAGDHIKSASDLGVPLVAVGLIYHRGYYEQRLSADGSTTVVRRRHRVEELPLEDTGLRVRVPLGRGRLEARVWRVCVGRVSLYLLDADVPENRGPDRHLTDDLYGGDLVYRLKQELLLGVGGVLVLEAAGEQPTVYHLNEGHAAFAALARLESLRRAGKSLEQALGLVRSSTVFTTHTPVAAGHDRFPPELVLSHLGLLAKKVGLGARELLALGRTNPDDDQESFCMTVLALRLAAHVNGVSRLHGEVTRRMWAPVYGSCQADQVPIGHVTNGVHSQSWLVPELEPLYRRYLKPRWLGAGPDHDPWRNAGRIPPAELWAVRNRLRASMIQSVRRRLVHQLLRQHAPAEEIAAAAEALDPRALTIGFARRFATYKRATLIFRDPARLARLLGDPERPVQLLFAGKAHPADAEGQALIRELVRYSRRPGLRGRVVLLEDYDLALGRLLTSGCDLWLNTPLRPYEASGTSGMKPPLAGGLNCSVLDGWWPEAFDGKNGWQIGSGAELATRAAQDRHDAESLYLVLEREIVPTFYRRDRRGLPRRWLELAVHSMQTVCSYFNTHRMVGEYVERYYLPAHQGRGA